jgi:alpha-amylase
VASSSFNEVTFYAQVGGGRWTPIGTDDTAPYRVYHDVSQLTPGTDLTYRAVVRDNAGHTARSARQSTVVPPPLLTIESPSEGSRVRNVQVRAVADPERATHVVAFERSVAGGPWTPIGSDDSSPVYTAVDDLGELDLAAGTVVQYRAILDDNGTIVVSDVRTVQAAGPQLETATLRYFRPAGDYADWGLHLWGEGLAEGVATAWEAPRQRVTVEAAGWAVYQIPLVDDEQPVNFIMHRPGGDSVPDTREPGGDRSFLPINNPEVWIVQGDPTVYTSEPPTP